MKESSKAANPESWLPTDIDDARSSLPIALQKDPLSYFSGQERDFPTAQRCLELKIAQSMVSRGQSRRLQRMELSSPGHRPGISVFTWLHRDYDNVDLSANIGFLKPLIHCLVADGAERLIWQWLRLPRTPKVMSSLRYGERSAWRGAVMRFLVEAQAYWAAETDGINPSIRSFKIANADEFTMPPGSDYNPLFIPKTAAGLWIQRQLLFTDANLSADPQLYDCFTELLSSWQPSEVELEFDQARLRCKHPENPSSLPSFDCFQRNLTATPRPLFWQELLQDWTGYGFITSLARMLDQEGHGTKARWMLDIGRREMPDYFSGPRKNVGFTSGGSGLGAEARQSRRRKPINDRRWESRNSYFDTRISKGEDDRDGGT